MTYTETMRQGSATVRRTSAKNIMRVLVEIIDADPTADNDRRFRTWSEAVKEDEDLLSAALRHVFTNLNTALEKHQMAGKPTQVRHHATPESVGAIKEQLRTIIVLDLVMPNGKKLRDCTGSFVKSLGHSFSRIATKVKPQQLVGQALSEEQIRKLWFK